MRMPSVTLAPLAPPLQEIRETINGLADEDRKALMSQLLTDRMRANDARHAANAEAAEQEKRARDRERRALERGQLRLESVA